MPPRWSRPLDIDAGDEGSAARLPGAEACRYPDAMPYSGAPADAVRHYFAEIGPTIMREESLSVARPLDLARVSAASLRTAMLALGGYGAEIVVQFGAALPTMRVAAEVEPNLGIPVPAANPVLYWHALRRCGIYDRIANCGRLLSEL